MRFKLRTPLQQFTDWFDSYIRQHREAPTSCYISRRDLTHLVNSMGYMPPADETIVHIFGVAMHIEGNK